ncbi:MAG: hypothetical protein FIB01_04135 [Gemmatimonadetes bacterium]|nr:hypothetical protein [Gemmatimonadota bacterium]
MSSTEFRTRAETRLAAAAAAATCADPRPPLRDRLRELKEGHPGAFERALAHYEQTVLPALAGTGEPLPAWVDYARFLGELTSPGRLVAIDGTGLASPYQAPAPGQLVLFLPDDPAVGVLVALAPAAPAPAQQATIDLLVGRKLSL